MTTLIHKHPHRGTDERGDWRRTLLIMAVGAVAVMMAGTHWDVSATKALIRHAMPGFDTLMGRTVFEGDLPGANDLVSLLLIVATIVYIYNGIKSAARIGAWRIDAGFVITCGLIIGLLMVHGLKYLIGRARPFLVLHESWAFSPWFAFGPHTIANGAFNASFPSGHTAQAFLLMAVAYLLAGNPSAPRTARTLGWVWGAVALCFSAAMGIARCASGNHWLTDVLGSICLGWLLIHWIYFGLLRVPAQQRIRTELGRSPVLPRAWELMLCIGIFLMTAGADMAVNGLRVAAGGGPLWFGGLIPLAALPVWLGWRLFRHYRQTVNAALDGSGGQA